MKFWASSEIYAPAGSSTEAVRHAIEPSLNRSLRGSHLADTDLMFRYIPIIMPSDMLDRYPSRSEARVKQRVLDCSPQLDYNVFVEGSFVEQVEVYLNGIRTAYVMLPKFGLSINDVDQFEAILLRVGKETHGRA